MCRFEDLYLEYISVTGVWVTSSLLKSPELFSVFWLISTALVWMVSIRLLIYKSDTPIINPFVTVQRASITTDTTVIFLSHSFFNYQARSRYLSFFSFSFNFTQWTARTVKFTILQLLSIFLLLLLIIIMSGRLTNIRWSVCITKSQTSFCVSFSWTDSGLYIYHLFISSNLNFLHSSECIS